jgi:ubiquinone/menaquinone biosynthesis C-methylase UbiE
VRKKRRKATTDFNAPDVVAQYEIYPLIHLALGRPAMLRFIGPVRGQRVLDLGCGTGHLSDALHRRGAICTGVDISRRFIDIAAARHPDVEFRVARGSRMPFIPPSSIDTVVLSMVILGISRKAELRAIFAECARILREDGEVVFSTIHPLNMRSFEDGFRRVRLPRGFSYFDSGARFETRVLLTDGSSMTFRDAHWTLQDVSEVLMRSGFALFDLEEPKLDPRSEHFRALEDVLITPYYLFGRAKKIGRGRARG